MIRQEHLFVKPAPGLKCRRPQQEGGRMLRDEGEVVPATSYWHRRLAAGDVVKVDPPRDNHHEAKPAKHAAEKAKE